MTIVARRNALTLSVRPIVGCRAKITAFGTYVPPQVLTNKDLEKLVDTNDQWILERTGIRERHVLAKGLGVSDICTEAAKKCLAMRGIPATEVEMIIVGTVTPDMMFPATACLVQDKIGAKGAWGFDVSAGCSGFVFALQAGVKMIESGAHKKVLVCGADANTRMTDYTDRTTCVLFGDGGGAVLLEPAKRARSASSTMCTRSTARGPTVLNLKGGGSLNPSSHETVDKKMHYIYQDGQAGLQVCRAQDAEGHHQGSGAQRRHRRGPGLLHSSPGQYAHHHGHRRPPGHGPRSCHHQHREVRQHLGRDDSPGH
jgi:3-oxoacyl-[acyl-carrier-protein] synthase-3